MGEELEPDGIEPFARCMDCNGPIRIGELARQYYNYAAEDSDDLIWVGAVHYFVSTCQQCREDSLLAEQLLLMEIKQLGRE